MKKEVTSISEICCADCGSLNWRVEIGNHSNGNTSLYLVCGNQECVDKKRKDLEVGKNEYVFWDEFDITGQGKDEDDLKAPDNILLN